MSRGLTPESFEALLAMLDPDREKAGEIYERCRQTLIRKFERRGCPVAEELADEVFNRVAGRVLEGVIIREAPLAYISGVARYVLQEYLRSFRRTEPIPDNWTPPSHPEDEPDCRLDHLNACLKLLDAEQSWLLLKYYEEEQRIQARQDLCKKLGIPLNALRIRVHRLRKKVHACVQEKLRN